MPVSLRLRFTVALRSSNRSSSTSSSRNRVQSRQVAGLQLTTVRPSTTPEAWTDRLIVQHPTPQQTIGSYRVIVTPRTPSPASPPEIRPRTAPSRPPSYTSSTQQALTRAPPPPITADERPPKYEPKDPSGTRWRRFCKRLKHHRKSPVRLVYIGSQILFFSVCVIFAIPALLICTPFFAYMSLVQRTRNR
jgi:hypothetical protein